MQSKGLVKDVIITSLNEQGILLDTSQNDVNITEYNIDSITFMTLIIDIENRLKITIPDEHLNISILQSLEGFVNLISLLI